PGASVLQYLSERSLCHNRNDDRVRDAVCCVCDRDRACAEVSDAACGKDQILLYETERQKPGSLGFRSCLFYMFLSAEDKFEDKTDKWIGITYLPEECHREVQSHSLEPDRDHRKDH